MKIIKAKFPGRCECGARICRGDAIGYEKGRRAVCEECAHGAADEAQEYGDEADGEEAAWPPSPAVLRSDRAAGRRGLIVARFSSGAVMTQNARGRCEDAPCCGCCC